MQVMKIETVVWAKKKRKKRKKEIETVFTLEFSTQVCKRMTALVWRFAVTSHGPLQR